MADRFVNYDKLLEKRHHLGLDEFSAITKVNAFNHFIDALPIADVVEVVRCKDCYYHNDEKHICTNTSCIKSFYGCRVQDNHFCSYGKRKAGFD